MKIKRLMTDEMVTDAFKKMLIFFAERKGMTLEEICSKPLEEILDEDELLISRFMTRVLVAYDMGLISEKDVQLILVGKKEWFPSDEFQEEYEKHWINLVRKAERGQVVF